MTLTLLNLYNSAATQEWAMYDNDAQAGTDFEESLVLAINKSIIEILSSYNFSFRERTHMIITSPSKVLYDMPSGIIKKDKNNKLLVRYNSKILNYAEDYSDFITEEGIPAKFSIKNDKIILIPTPNEKGLLTIDYYTLAIGENSNGEDIYVLKNADDTVSVPIYLEEIMKEAIITRTILKTIASESDENYSAYKKQADNAYKLLIKYSKGIEKEKTFKF